MNIEITERIPRDKWLAALGTHGTRDESLNETLDEVESALLAAAKPKAEYKSCAGRITNIIYKPSIQ